MTASSDDLPVCARCRRPVRRNRKHYETYERMHWSCFHYAYEHGEDRDPDEACADPLCPARAFDPNPPPEGWPRGKDHTGG